LKEEGPEPLPEGGVAVGVAKTDRDIVADRVETGNRAAIGIDGRGGISKLGEKAAFLPFPAEERVGRMSFLAGRGFTSQLQRVLRMPAGFINLAEEADGNRSGFKSSRCAGRWHRLFPCGQGVLRFFLAGPRPADREEQRRLFV